MLQYASLQPQPRRARYALWLSSQGAVESDQTGTETRCYGLYDERCRFVFRVGFAIAVNHKLTCHVGALG